MVGQKKNRYSLALDPRVTDMAAVAFQWGRNGDAIPGGFARVPCKGFRNGIVVNMKDAVASVARAVENIKVKTGTNIQQIYSTVSAAGISISRSEGTIVLSRYGREIFERDIRKCVEIAETVKTPLDRDVLHSMVRDFTVDDEENILDPRNLEGVKLRARVNNITVNSNVIKNISSCIARAGYVPAGFVFSALASSFRALEDEDRKSGVILVNICSELIEAVIYFEDILYDSKVIAGGSNELIVEEGTLSGDFVESLINELRGMKGWKYVKRIILTGEAVMNDNFIELLEPRFQMPVKAGKCLSKPFEHLPPDKTGYIGSLGMIDFLQEKRQKKKKSAPWRLFGDYITSFIDEYF
jgi:hypothetical protein